MTTPTETWLPWDYLDEAIPPPRTTPEAWVIEHGGVLALSSADEYIDSESEPSPLQEGEVIEFGRCLHYGEATLTLAAGGAWSVNADKPTAAEMVCVLGGWQVETLSSSVAEAVERLLEGDAKPGDYTLSYYTWTGPHVFSFDAAARRFTAIASA